MENSTDNYPFYIGEPHPLQKASPGGTGLLHLGHMRGIDLGGGGGGGGGMNCGGRIFCPTTLPQNLHLAASIWINSEQNGHFFKFPFFNALAAIWFSSFPCISRTTPPTRGEQKADKKKY